MMTSFESTTWASADGECVYRRVSWVRFAGPSVATREDGSRMVVAMPCGVPDLEIRWTETRRGEARP